MNQKVKEAYKEGRRAASLEPQMQQEIRSNIVVRAETASSEVVEKSKIQGSVLSGKRKDFVAGVEKLLMGKTIEAHRQNKRMGIFYFAIFLVLLVAEFILIQWTLEPFDLGTEGFILAIAIMLTGVTAIEEYLRALNSKNPLTFKKYKNWLVFICATFFLATVILLSNARSELIAANSSGSGLENQIAAADKFYSNTNFIYLAIGLAALSIAIIGGVVLHESINRLLVSSPVLSTYRKLRGIETSIAGIAIKIKEWELLPKKAGSEYDKGIHDGPPSDENPLLSPLAMIIFAVILLVAISTLARGAECINESVIVLFDLSGSAKEVDFSNQTEFQKNRLFLDEIIKNLKPGSHLRVVGITDKSFDKPFIILDCQLSQEKGYFSENLAKEKLSLINKWNEIEMNPISKRTDIFGALMLASLLFESETGNKQLIILSDLRNSNGINMETPSLIDMKIMEETEKRGFIANLEGVDVLAFGVSTTNKSFQYWNSLKTFWVEYMKKSGAHLVSFSIERKWDERTDRRKK